MKQISLNVEKSNPVTISSIEELNKFIFFAGGDDRVLLFTPFGWQSVFEFSQCNDINELF